MPRLLVLALLFALAVPAAAQRIPCSDGTADGYPCQDVHLWSRLPIDQLGGVSGTKLNDVWGWTDEATGRRYAVVGRSDGTAFVDVTDPEAPVFLGSLPTHDRASSWRDVKVYEHFALVVADNAGAHGLQLFDLHRLRGLDGSSPASFTEDAHYDRFSEAHNVVVDTTSGYAYVVGIGGSQDVPAGSGCGPGLHMVDVSDPLDPQFAGCFNHTGTGRSGTGYVHDAQCIVYQGPDVAYQGHELCFGSNETHLSIVDVTDKGAPQVLSSATYPNVGYAHQGWLTEDHRYFLMNDELDERNGLVAQTRTLVWDIVELDDPQLVTEYLHDVATIDHNLYVVGDYAYEANYTSGLRILDVADPTGPALAGYFDVFPGSDDQVYDGAWSVYPFFRDDVVLVSSISGGLFVLQPDLAAGEQPAACLDPETEPLYAGGFTVDESNSQYTLAVEALQGLHEVKVYDRTNMDVGFDLYDAAQGGGPIAGYTRSVSAPDTVVFTYTGGGSAPAEAHVPFARQNTGSTHVRFFMALTDGCGRTVDIDPVFSLDAEAPDWRVRTMLELAGPNPFRTATALRYVLPEASAVRLVVYDVLGREVALLAAGTQPAGEHVVDWEAGRLQAGSYFVRLTTSEASVTTSLLKVE